MLLSVCLAHSMSAYSAPSCDNLSQWVKPLQHNAIKDRQGNLIAKSIFNASQAFDEYKSCLKMRILFLTLESHLIN